MNFYTYFKTETKRLYKLMTSDFCFAGSSERLHSLGLNNLSLYRNYLLRSCFGFANLRCFQVACYRVLPIDYPKSFYEKLYDMLFTSDYPNSVNSYEYDILNDFRKRLTSELVSIFEAENV